MNDELIAELAQLILSERAKKKSDNRYEKIQKVLLLLGKGALLSSALLMPGTAKLLKGPGLDSEWKEFNQNYLKKTIKKLEKQKIVQVSDGMVKLTSQGGVKVLTFGIESLVISRPARWDGKWRIVFYDVLNGKAAIRDKFRRALVSAGFFPLQESVYLHAYPCEREIEFLKYYLGISGEVRIVIAQQIENDKQFRDYFGLSV